MKDARFERNLLLNAVASSSLADYSFQTVSFSLTVPDTPELGTVEVQLNMWSNKICKFNLWYVNGNGRRGYEVTMEVEWGWVSNAQGGAWIEEDDPTQPGKGEKIYRRRLEWKTDNVVYKVVGDVTAEEGGEEG